MGFEGMFKVQWVEKMLGNYLLIEWFLWLPTIVSIKIK